jgi:glutaminyl-peptide cyclotransferase
MHEDERGQASGQASGLTPWLMLALLAGTAVAFARPRAPGQDVHPAARQAPVLKYDVVKTYAHDPKAFTQGLIFRNGFLYESTGLKGQSSLRKVRLETGEVIDLRAVDKQFFAEGLTDWGAKLLQLTWETNIGFVYDLASFAPLTTFTYTGEGWGLTHDDTQLIMSDGSSALRFLDPNTQREIRRVTVRDGGKAIDRLNELEFVKGEVFANVWLTDRIAIIAPSTGMVTAWLDLAQLHAPSRQGEDVLNGIAYDAAGNRLFVTGKLWSRLYEIKVRR